LEALENRLVPAYPFNPGTILFTNYHTSSIDDNGKALTGILGIENPGTPKAPLIPEAVDGSLATGSTPFQEPAFIFPHPNYPNVFYVTDDGNFGLDPPPLVPVIVPAVLEVSFSSTSNPLVTMVCKGGYLHSPTGVVALPDNNGKVWLYVADTGNNFNQLGKGYVIKIDPITGVQTQLSGTLNHFQCPVSLALVYNAGVVDNTHLWLDDQGGNGHSGYGPGELWQVDLTNNGNNAPTPFSKAGLLDIHTDTINPPRNYALGNPDDFAVDPSTGNLYFGQYGDQTAAGSVVEVVPPPTPPQDLTSDQVEINQDDGTTDHPTTATIGWYVAGVGWDPSYKFSQQDSEPALIVTTVYKNGAPNQGPGHFEAVSVNPNDKVEAEVTSSPDANNKSYVGTPTHAIVYGSGTDGYASLPGPGQSGGNLASLVFASADSVDTMSAMASARVSGTVFDRVDAAILEQATGLGMVADRPVLVYPVDPFWHNEQEQHGGDSHVQAALPSKPRPWSREAEAAFMEFAKAQRDGLVTNP
jgi:hypothetical protein